MTRKTKAGYFLAGVLAALLLVNMAAPALAAVGKTIQVYTGIDIYVDDVKLNPTDANGNPVEPFLYNGTTYLPVRAVSEALGKAVQWDGKTRSVYVGKHAGSVTHLMEVCPPYKVEGARVYYSPVESSFSMAGKVYGYGLTVGNRNYKSKERVYFNLNGQYQTLKCTIGPTDDSEDTQEIVFIVDGTIVAQYKIESGDMPMEVTIPLDYGLQLMVANVQPEEGGHSGIIGVGEMIVE